MYTTSSTIKIENDVEYFRPGEIIKGLVTLNIAGTSNILIKALSLQFTGFAYTKWEKADKTNKSNKTKAKTYTEFREDYVSTTNYLIGSEMAIPKAIEPGEYSYNFMINIPPNIPSTFDSALGFIRYELKVNTDYGDHTTCLCNTTIKIQQLKDLRLMDPVVKLPAETEQQEQKSRIAFWQQPLLLYVSVPQKAFVAGECISVHIRLINPSKIKVDVITTNLNRITTYRSLIRGNTFEKNTEITTIATKIYNINGQNTNAIHVIQEMFVPETLLTMAFDECKCIELTYELEILVTTQNKRRWVKAIIPILIGSISLRSELKIEPDHLINNNVSSILVARSMEELTCPSFMETTRTSASINSLGSSFKEADFMTTVNLNKSSKRKISKNVIDFRPKYLYYDPSIETKDLLSDKIII